MNDLKHAAEMILTDIDCHVVKNADRSHRNHLGASEIGDPCQRKLWYKFRWVKKTLFGGRMLRLFDRGDREEAVFVALLRQAGWTVWPTNPADIDPKTGKERQFRFSQHDGHFGGSMDGIALPPANSQYAWLGHVIVEFKTSKDATWKKLDANGVKNEHPRHSAQMHLYGAGRGVQYAVYLSVNKDNDKLFCEVLPIDPARAQMLSDKAGHIIMSPTPPPKLSEDPTWWECKFCDYYSVCHQGAAIEKNCRSCRHAAPATDSGWWCGKHDISIPADQITKEQPCWEGIV